MDATNDQFSDEYLIKLQERLEFIRYTVQMYDAGDLKFPWDYPSNEMKRMKWEGIEMLRAEQNKIMVEIEALSLYLGGRE